MHLLYIYGMDFERDAWRGHAVRGVRAAWDLLDEVQDQGQYREALKIVDGFAENSHTAALVGTSDDLDLLMRAAEAMHDVSDGVVGYQIDPESLELGEAEPAAEDGEDQEDEDLLAEVYSPSAYKTALALLAYSNGNPTVTYYRTFQMERVTEDKTLWEEVRACILSVFPFENSPGFHVIGDDS